MSTSNKQQELLATNAEEPTLIKDSSLEKLQDSLPEPEKQPTSQSQSLTVENADTATQSFYQRRSKILGKFYSGIQGEIYD